MSGKKRVNLGILVLVVVLVALCAMLISCDNVEQKTPFTYRNNPEDNPTAMADIVADPDAVYGFRPSETGSLNMYLDIDWSDETLINGYKEERIEYHRSIDTMYDIIQEMQLEHASIEEMARAVSTKRNELRLAAYENDPEGLAEVKNYNFNKYGHEEGPLPDELYEKYGSWEMVMSKAFSANSGLDACLGLYDQYFFLYVALGQVSAHKSSFTYRNNPEDNPTAMADIVADPDAVYGFRPSETGSLNMYLDIDWSDETLINGYKEERIEYHRSIDTMYDIIQEMQLEHASIEEMARAVSTKRNELRLAAYENDPEGLAEVKNYNFNKYGHEEGPLPDELYEKYGSWEMVMSKAFSANSGLDACLGLYDQYFFLYAALGQVRG